MTNFYAARGLLMSLVIIGSVAFDAIETPFGKTDKIVGGAGTYASLAASYFYHEVKIISVVGDDFPDLAIQNLKNHGVDVSGIQIKAGEKSFFWAGRYHNDMNNRDTITTELNVLANFDPIVPDAYQDCEFLLLGNLSPQVQQKTIQRLQKRPKLIVMDTMNFWMDIAMDSLLETIRMVDILAINDAEARQLSGEYSLVKAAHRILQMGPAFVVIKKGEHGALLFHGDQLFSAPGLPLADVCDPTGAGDAFAGGLTGYLAKVGTTNFNNVKNAIIYGSALASFCVEKFGIEKITNLSQSEIAKRIEKFVDLSSFSIK